MPDVVLYRLRPRGPMHFGTRGVVTESALTPADGDTTGDTTVLRALPFPSAATFFGAWCWSVRDLAGERALVEMLDVFRDGEPPFLLAAPMPWIGDVLLLPRPAVPARLASATGADASESAPTDKRGKKYRWVEEGLWNQLAAGENVAEAFENDKAFHQGQTIWAHGEAGEKLETYLAQIAANMATDVSADLSAAFWRVATVHHVTVDRATRSGNLYHVGATWFAPTVDLALPVIWRQPGALRPVLEQALALLGEVGVGGERSNGFGQFDWTASEVRQWPDIAGASAFATLAGYHPTKDEVQAGVFAEPASYDLEMNRGWVERSTYRHAVRLVTAGSVLRHVGERAVYGGLADVTPGPMDNGQSRVYRYGFAFPFPVTAPAITSEGE